MGSNPKTMLSVVLAGTPTMSISRMVCLNRMMRLLIKGCRSSAVSIRWLPSLSNRRKMETMRIEKGLW